MTRVAVAALPVAVLTTGLVSGSSAMATGPAALTAQHSAGVAPLPAGAVHRAAGTGHRAAAAAAQTTNMLVTLYGWDDNSPPGCDTAYSGCAGGTGTFSDPITFATDQAELPVGTLVYYTP